MKKLFFLFFCLFLVGFVSAGCSEVFNRECTPASRYDYCAEVSWNCDGAVSYSKVQISDVQTEGEQHGQYSTGDTYINFNLVGDTGYFNENINSNNWWDYNCNDYGCAGSDMWGADSIKLTNNPGDHYTDCPMFYAFDRAESGGYYSISIAALGWFGNGGCSDIKQVECYDDSDCSGNLVCDKSGSWESWSCVQGQEPCPSNLGFNPSLPYQVHGCSIWQYFSQYNHCNGGWFIYNPDTPSSLQMSYGQYREIAPPSCWQTPCSEDWECSSWSTCLNEQQTRECVDNNNCGTEDEKPPLIQDCVGSSIYYLFDNNQCFEVSILPEQRTENDYETLAECESNIVEEGEESPENVWDKIWFTKFGIDFTIPVLLTSFTVLVFVLRILRHRK